MISFIIPTLQEERVIGTTLRHLKDGMRIPHELIVSDGGSSDQTTEIAGHFADKVVIHKEARRQTIAEGRNAGAEASHGEFLVFLDADTTIDRHEKFFGKILNRFDLDPKLVAVNVAIRVLPEHETCSDWVITNLFNDYLWFVNNILHFGMGAGEFQMVRRSAFEQIGGYNKNLVASEDIELFARLSKIGNVRYMKGLRVYHSGRRAHKVGWPKLLSLWFLNSVFMMFFGRAFVKEWKVIR